MDVIKIRPWTVTGLFLGGMFLAVGMLFMIAFWHEASREPVVCEKSAEQKPS